jgi:hypothetical protein
MTQAVDGTVGLPLTLAHYQHFFTISEGPSLGYAALPQAEVCKVLNEQILLMAMIETPEAVENADAIAPGDGIDVLHIGASDLSTEMGIPGQHTHERLRAAFETVAQAAKGRCKSRLCLSQPHGGAFLHTQGAYLKAVIGVAWLRRLRFHPAADVLTDSRRPHPAAPCTEFGEGNASAVQLKRYCGRRHHKPPDRGVRGSLR